ncbi:metal ABC transporter permease [Candidatus Odyssella thessalonicensis]|uniref:metal ABC transporter permease n=1 Tax=Candidatus Odyssella thessalonicensis TaxID=84647 RepID=UPI000225C0A9|nr:metal ABC transporter permease [Candidatus Odyssella thessalonicensis]
MYDIFIAPFMEYVFMRRALLACMAISFSCGPIGVLLVLRRMSLLGDALSHAILPGIAVGYLITGLWLPGLSLGGIAAGLLVAAASGLVTRRTILHEDASFTGFYLIALALGILILSVKGGNMNLTHFLFGSVLAVDHPTMIYIVGVTTFSLITLAVIYRPLVYECFDPTFVKLLGSKEGKFHAIFMILVVINLVGACQALGTLMALGIMMLPAITARLISTQVWSTALRAVIIAASCSYLGLILSFQFNWPSGPTIILLCGLVYLSVLSLTALKSHSHS